MPIKRVVVLGASAGGVQALKDVVSAFPANLDAAVLVVLHIPPYVSSRLPEILSSAGPLKANHPPDNTKIEPGVIYVAPPDHHLLVSGDSVLVKRGPKENRFRPSIDALFRSAAYVYGSKAIGLCCPASLMTARQGSGASNI